MKCDLNHEVVLSLINYNPESGKFTRKNGKQCGTKTKNGYIHVRLLGKKRLAHRLAWFYVYGEWPAHEIDHINGVVRGMRGDEALNAVQYFIDDAILVVMPRVRILHGKGNGILRQLIRQYLSSVPNVTHYADEHVQFGGSGITVVDF